MLAIGLGPLASAWVAAGAAIGGVVVTSFTQIWVDSRKERREQQRAVRHGEEDMRLAARLVAYRSWLARRTTTGGGQCRHILVERSAALDGKQG